MTGLIIWAHSYCRSTLAFFRGLGTSFKVPLKLFIWKVNAKLRTNVGFTEDEFSDMDITFIGDNIDLGLKLLREHRDYHHIFGAYQAVPIYQHLILEAKNLGCKVAIASEAPCNMTPGVRRIPKDLYIKTILPFKVKNQIEVADYIINFSGDDSLALEKIGWSPEKIIPCGYYSPRIEGTKLIKRGETYWNDFSILLTGLHQWHRSPMLLLKALAELKKQGLTPVCNITQEGPLLSEMKSFASAKNLTNVNFLGFVPMEKLKNLYETCSVYVGTGNYEPWGMRLNDVLQCGAPLVVNEGMGGVKMVRDYGCGLSFEHDNYNSLADALKKLITDKELYLKVSDAAYTAALEIIPEKKSQKIVDLIKQRYQGW